MGSFMSCAKSYNLIRPKSIEYNALSASDDVILEYKYDLLDSKYANKEERRGVKLVALKITNNTDRDLTFGRDVKLISQDGIEIYPLSRKVLYNKLKQRTPGYLLYLFLTPLRLSVDGESIPIGYGLGPGLTGWNMINGTSANKKFETELWTYDLDAKVITKGEIQYGLIGFESTTYQALKIKLEN